MSREEFEILIDKYLSGQASEDEERLIEDFFVAHERHESEGMHSTSEMMWATIENRIHNGALQGKDAEVSHGKSKPIRRRVWAGVCAGVALLAVVIYIQLQQPFSRSDAQPWITLDTPNGQKSIVTLPDGSRIFLNAGSTISYPEVFSPGLREVKLSGEAFFEVAKNPEQPFVVTAGNVITEVLGTSFNIEAFPDKQVSVTVATGRVQVEIGSSETQQGDSSFIRRVILAPNNQATYNPKVKDGFIISEVDLQKYLAWKDNTLFFEDTSIKDVAALLERWYNVTIEFENDQIKNCRINGKYKDQSLESVLKSIQYMYHIDFRFTLPNKVRLSGTDCSVQPVNSS